VVLALAWPAHSTSRSVAALARAAAAAMRSNPVASSAITERHGVLPDQPGQFAGCGG
jgi:hypothetical protein